MQIRKEFSFTLVTLIRFLILIVAVGHSYVSYASRAHYSAHHTASNSHFAPNAESHFFTHQNQINSAGHPVCEDSDCEHHHHRRMMPSSCVSFPVLGALGRIALRPFAMAGRMIGGATLAALRGGWHFGPLGAIGGFFAGGARGLARGTIRGWRGPYGSTCHF